MAERILAVAAKQPTASRRGLLFRIARDPELPPHTRMAIAEQLAAAKGGHGGAQRSVRQAEKINQAALLAIVQNASAATKGRRKAATKLAAHLLPMKPANRRWWFEADDCGFASARKRQDGIVLTAAEDADEAHRKARF